MILHLVSEANILEHSVGRDGPFEVAVEKQELRKYHMTVQWTRRSTPARNRLGGVHADGVSITYLPWLAYSNWVEDLPFLTGEEPKKGQMQMRGRVNGALCLDLPRSELPLRKTPTVYDAGWFHHC